MVMHDTNGYLVQPGDVEALANAMDELLSNDALAEKFAEASYRHAANFSWETAAEILVEKINMLLDYDRLPSQSQPPAHSDNSHIAQQPSPLAGGTADVL